MPKRNITIGDTVRIVKSDLKAVYGHTKDVGMTCVVDRINTYRDHTALLLDFGREYEFTHNGSDHKECHYRWYDDDCVELVTGDVSIAEITTEEFNAILGF